MRASGASDRSDRFLAEQEELERPPSPAGGDEVDDAVYKTVADAYYRKAIEAPTAARANSQNAYTIAAAVAAAVITAGAFADLAGEPLGVRIVGAAALVAWLLTAGLFMYAVAAPHLRARTEPNRVFNELAFVEAALQSAKNERDTVNRRQLYARIAAALASLLTVTVVGLAIFLPSASTAERISVNLAPADRARLSALCKMPVPAVMSGVADSSSLDDGTIAFDPDEKQCATPGITTLQEKKTVFILAP